MWLRLMKFRCFFIAKHRKWLRISNNLDFNWNMLTCFLLNTYCDAKRKMCAASHSFTISIITLRRSWCCQTPHATDYFHSSSPGVWKVTLVAGDGHHYVGRTVLPQLLHPVLQCLERLLMIQVEKHLTQSEPMRRQARRINNHRLVIFRGIFIFDSARSSLDKVSEECTHIESERPVCVAYK